MKPFKSSLLSSAVIPAALLAAGVLSAPVAATPGATLSVQVASNPCGPCGAAAAPVELTTAEAVAVYNCLKDEMKSA
jgi:hypothetical protein